MNGNHHKIFYINVNQQQAPTTKSIATAKNQHTE